MRVTLVAFTTSHRTNMSDETGGRWEAEGDGDSGDLIEFAGRQCYESWGRPNPATSTNVGYIGNLTDQKHLSVLEHGALSFRVSDVSRALTHELVRHRHFSFSQVSQRYVNPVDSGMGSNPQAFVAPPLFADDSAAKLALEDAWVFAIHQYQVMLRHADRILVNSDVEDRHTRRKMAREAARAVLPNMTPTALVVTANHHAWFDFFGKRGTVHADQEIRALAVEIARQCKAAEPNVYARWQIQDVKIGQINTEVITYA
jgi:thymidylate synthase (FAD)